MEFSRIVVFGDLHGDLDIILASLSERGLVRYEGELDKVIELLKACLNKSESPELEAIVIPQAQPVRVIFLGDFLDRYHFGYHIIQFLSKIRWETFGIYPIFMLGNHDLLNVHFFTNPFETHEIYNGCGHTKSETISYIENMGIEKSLESFKALHCDEILNLQTRFYETGMLQHQEVGYSVQYQYSSDLSFLVKHSHGNDSYTGYYNQMVDLMGFDSEKHLEDDRIKSAAGLGHVLFKRLREFTADKEPRNWWILSQGSDDDGYDNYRWEMAKINLLTLEEAEEKITILPIDWRVISLIWRHHYGNFFRRTRLLHTEGNTLFVHGGLSPLAMQDPLVFGNIYDPRQDTFEELRDEYQYDLSLEKLINRSNRLVSQVLENALNDYSFSRMSGMEVVDQMGYWRGVAQGYPTFGGPIWCDFEYIQDSMCKHERIQQLYQAFKKATGIDRIICGHTQFKVMDKPEIRYRKSSEFQDLLGIEYICVDNACSRGYRYDEPVLNGIEIDKDGQIQGVGEIKSSSMF